LQVGIKSTLMRGGTSKGVYFLSDNLPDDEETRDRVLLSVMGSPDDRQIDGIGGANPLTSKVAVVSRSERPGVDVDYLFAQVFVDRPVVGYGQNCGNILAGIGPFAIEQGLVEAKDPATDVVIHMVNSGDTAIATIQTPGGEVNYAGDARVDGVPGTSAPVVLNFLETAGSMCGALLPTGNTVDEIEGVKVTCIDNGMPIVVLPAMEFGIMGDETVEQMEANTALKERLERIRLELGPKMNLGDVTDKTVPKMTLISPPKDNGIVSTRSFIPHRCHSSIGVFAAVTVATACLIPGTPASEIASMDNASGDQMSVEHPSGAMDVEIEVEKTGEVVVVKRSAYLRTTRKISEGVVYVPEEIFEASKK